MGLQVWLPLNGDLNNYGLSNMQFINDSAVVNTAGKIGSCYEFNANAYIKESNYNWSSFNTSQFSLCCWYKEPSPVASGNSQMICIGTSSGWNNIRIGLLRRTSTGRPIFSVSDGSSAIQYACSTTANIFTFDAWHHIAVTYNNGTINMYVDGQLDTVYTTIIVPVLTASQHLGIGAASNGAEKLTGFLNDVRIYDHALSAKEVKEIAKGLVLHYKLDQSNANLISLNIFNIDPWKSAINAREMHKEKYAYRVTNNILYSKTSSGTLPVFPDLIFKENTQYTFSLDWIDDYRTDNKNSSLYFRFQYTDGSTATQIISPAHTITEWVHAKMTSTSGKTISKITTTYGNGGQLYVANIKLEEGTLDTGYTNSTDNIIYDSSGYNHNGIIVGAVGSSTDTRRYDSCKTFVNGSHIYVNEKPSVCLPKDAITVNGWFKHTAWPNPISCTESGGWNFESASGYVQFPVYISGVGYKVAKSDITIASLANAWHMITGTFDRTNVKIYIDGVLRTTTPTDSTNGIGYANNYLFIGAEAQGNTTTPANSGYVGNISDIRIYCTALDADDIMELYNTSAAVDKNGNVYAREVIEV